MGGAQSSSSPEPSGHEAQLDSPASASDGTRYRVVFETQPFAKGSCRLALLGVYLGRGPKSGRRCVVKIPREGASSDDYEDNEADLKASRTASELVDQFNEDYVSSKPMRFIVPQMATVLSVCQPNRLIRPGDKVLVEDHIEGTYEKFNNNTSYHSDGVATVPCFSHYTYYKTGGRLLVCDIQGVRTPSGYVLTDPAVHSRQAGKFGATDLGPNGMVRFFSCHRCTNVCVRFPISDFRRGRDGPEKPVVVTRKNYCGGRLNGSESCDCCDGRCGPYNGCNCVDCMLKDLEDFGLLQSQSSRALVNREGAVSKLSCETNKFYCGRRNMTRDRMTDGSCGPINGNNCHACRQLDIQARDRYGDIVNQWYRVPPAIPSSVVYRR